VASLGSRLLGLLIDWVVTLLIVSIFVGGEVWTGRGWVQAAPLLVLFVEQALLVGLLGTAIGHRQASGWSAPAVPRSGSDGLLFVPGCCAWRSRRC
jgi:hypothetical protein